MSFSLASSRALLLPLFSFDLGGGLQTPSIALEFIAPELSVPSPHLAKYT